ncbi:MFS transporter, partial [Lactobacillus sp. XV13L]|nr:MFS transporter [Lactobacillus sp. XV13L]
TVLILLPCFGNSYPVILLSRLAVGLAVGVFTAVATSLIVQLYRQDKDTMAHMMGYQNTIQTLGSAIGSFVVGWLVSFGWHQVFLVYLIPLVLIILFGLFVNGIDDEDAENRQIQVKTKKHFKFTGEVLLIVFFMFSNLILYMPTNFTLPRLIIAGNMGTAATSAWVTGLLRIFTMVTAALFGFLLKRIGNKVFPIGFVIQVIGYYLISISSNIVFLLFSLLLLGIGNSLVLPYLYNWMGLLTDAETSNTGQSILMIALNVGTVVSPTVMNGVNKMMGTASPRNIMLICALGNVILLAIALLNYFVQKRRTKAK